MWHRLAENSTSPVQHFMVGKRNTMAKGGLDCIEKSPSHIATHARQLQMLLRKSWNSEESIKLGLCGFRITWTATTGSRFQNPQWAGFWKPTESTGCPKQLPDAPCTPSGMRKKYPDTMFRSMLNSWSSKIQKEMQSKGINIPPLMMRRAFGHYRFIRNITRRVRSSSWTMWLKSFPSGSARSERIGVMSFKPGFTGMSKTREWSTCT